MKFDKVEIRDILISIVVLAVAVSGIGPNWRGSGAILTNLASVFIPLATAFFFHEMAHKRVAISYGYRSFFRMWPQGLMMALLIGIVSSGSFLFAAPGAVMIQGGNISVEENGRISVSGPLTNLLIAGLFYPLATFGGLLGSIGYFGVIINLWLAFFNLLPIPPLDGKKIFNWRPKIGAVLLGLTGFLLFFVF